MQRPHLPSRTPWLLVVLFSGLLFAAPASGDRSVERDLAHEIEQVVAAVAQERGGIVPHLSAPLSAAATDLCRLSTDEGPPPGSEIISDALNLHSVVEPAPHLVLTSYSPGTEAAFLAELRRRVPEILSQGHFRLLGAGIVPLPTGIRRVLLMFLESFVNLQPVPREAPVGTKEVTIQGELLPPFARPEVLITDPNGQVSRVALSVRGDVRKGEATGRVPFSGPFYCQSRGRYQLEILGEDRTGSTVLANFPIYCGKAAPTKLAAMAEAPEQADRPLRDAADAEQQLFALLQADRVRFGLPRLTYDPRLAAVARAHSQEMVKSGVLGHVSQASGDASDRVRKAGLSAPTLLENLARAYSPDEAERGLMDSPGHRANILSRAVTQAGIGVQLNTLPGGVTELWVTQLFIRPPDHFDPARTPREALLRVQELRKQAGQEPLSVDPVLEKLAAEAASGLSQGRLTEEQVGQPAQAALPTLDRRYRVLRTVLLLTTDVKGLAPSMAITDAKVNALGLAVAPAPQGKNQKMADGLYVVMVVAERVDGGKSR